MRRFLVVALSLHMLSQSSGIALAASGTPISEGDLGAWLSALRSTVAMVIPFSQAGHPTVRHTPLPRRPMTDYGSHQRYAQLIVKPRRAPMPFPAVKPIDLVKLRLEHHEQRRIVTLVGSQPRRLHRRGGVHPNATLGPSLTGILPWWTYQERSIPGVGKAMVNVANLNFLLEENDVDIPAGGLDLAFRRVYNSESQHDQNNDDNTTPSVYGNRWTNNLDVHLGWTASSSTVSVYTADGAREDFTCTINQAEICTAAPGSGVYDVLATTDVVNFGTGQVACQLQWTKKSGVSYMFAAPYPDCTSNPQGYWGRLLSIVGRNNNFSINLAYSWSPDATNPENLTSIVVTHEPDQGQLTLVFGKIAQTNITELASVLRPDNAPNNEAVNYHYTSTGDLVDVDKPGNNPMLPGGGSLPQQFLDLNPIQAGNLPETYDITQQGLLEVCGPRAAISNIKHNGSPSDGACVDFDYNNHQLTDWWTRGVLNPAPSDGVTNSNIQSGPSAGFVQWDDTQFFNNIVEPPCASVTDMSDAYGHNVQWCYDTSSRVTQTSVATASATWLTTSQTWDGNNNLITTTDARGNTTNMAYDSNGNTVEVSLPQQNSIRPTSFYDYDAYNNVIRYCDPANNSNNAWTPSASDSLCQQYGNKYATFTYSSDPGQTSDPNEAYGCLIATSTPTNYQNTVSYSNSKCGTGLPYTVQAVSAISQYDQSSRKPTETFNYNSIGNLTSYNAGNGAWQINYNQNGTNRVTSRVDPDGVTSQTCYNLDGSIFYTETAYQANLDGNGGCPGDAQLISGAQAPKHAVAYGYDADGDVATELHHHNCTTGNCLANGMGSNSCNSITVSNGAICNFYDGLDRLVEVKQPYDSNFDLYANPWITRYLYDLTGGTYTFQNSPSFYAYGNLFMTQELLTSGTGSVSVTWTSNTTTPHPVNATYQAIKATAYDGMDRPVAKYSLVAGSAEQLNTETLIWDSSPLDNNVQGYLGKECNAVSQCQQFDYTPDGQMLTFKSNDGSSPERSYTYDPDGRALTIASGAYNNPQQYSYDADGNVHTATDPSGAVNQVNAVTSPATITRSYYADDSLESISVASSALTQTNLFQYAYRKDGRLSSEQLNDSSLPGSGYGKTTLSYTYTSAGRVTERDESGVGSNATATTMSYDLPQTNPTGLQTKVVTPSSSLNTFTYSADSEPVTFNMPNFGQLGYTYTLRGEHVCGAGCPVSGVAHTWMANGVAIHQQEITKSGQSFFFQWDDNMAVSSAFQEQGQICQGSTWCPSSAWAYDEAGRLTNESGPIGGQQVTGAVYRCYDAENHTMATTPNSGPCNNPSTGTVTGWGPNGHPITVGTFDSSGNLHNETLHWDGNQLLFTTRKANGADTLDDIKVGTQGDVLPQDQVPGLVFFDRGPGGAVMGCHNAVGGVSNGLGDVWMQAAVGPLGPLNSTPCYSKNGGMPTSIDWYGTMLIYGSNLGGQVGQGGVLGMPRTDGLTDNADSIQGVRTFDNTAGVWTTPDALAGVVTDPRSQKSYMWNGNNPVQYEDPTGFDRIIVDARNALDFWPMIIGGPQHTYIKIIHDDGTTVTISFGPVASKSGGLPRLGLEPQGYEDGKLVNGSFVLASCERTCTLQNGGFCEQCALNEADKINQQGQKYLGTEQNSNSATTTTAAAGGKNITSVFPGLWTPGNMDVLPFDSTGFSDKFVENAAQAEGFQNQNQQWIY